MPLERRRFLQSAAAAALCLPFLLSAQKAPPQSEASGALLLRDYTPKTRLEVKQTKIVRAKFPVIDVHLHMNPDADPVALDRLEHALLRVVAFDEADVIARLR